MSDFMTKDEGIEMAKLVQTMQEKAEKYGKDSAEYKS
jgi:hypothetical protein